MPLIQCPDCGREVSTEALACPGCGRPLKPPAGPTPPVVPVVVQAVRNRGLFIVLGLFLGCFGIHNFYAGYHGRGAVQLLITALFGWLIIGFVITAIWAIIEIITVSVDAKGNPMS
jgi:TM2 domain-containing membrane protein YozV